MNRFIEVTVNDPSFANERKVFIEETNISGRVLLETSNIQCVQPAAKGSLIILKTRNKDYRHEGNYIELKVDETYESLKQLLIQTKE